MCRQGELGGCGERLGGEHEDVAPVVLFCVRRKTVNRVEDRGGVGSSLFLCCSVLLENRYLDRGPVGALVSMRASEGTTSTHIEHVQRVGDARVARRERAPGLVAVEVLLDARLA